MSGNCPKIQCFHEINAVINSPRGSCHGQQLWHVCQRQSHTVTVEVSFWFVRLCDSFRVIYDHFLSITFDVKPIVNWGEKGFMSPHHSSTASNESITHWSTPVFILFDVVRYQQFVPQSFLSAWRTRGLEHGVIFMLETIWICQLHQIFSLVVLSGIMSIGLVWARGNKLLKVF